MYPPCLLAYLSANVLNIFGSRVALSMKAEARSYAGRSPRFPRVIIFHKGCSSAYSRLKHGRQFTFSANRAVSFALGKVVLICSCSNREVTRFLEEVQGDSDAMQSWAYRSIKSL